MESPTDQPSVLVLAGPTGVGKTELSLELAEVLRAEIVSADSRQIFRGMSIGTAKPTAEEMARIPHHFIDERNPDEPYSAGAFAEDAWRRIAAIRARGRQALVVGGSTLYLEALARGLSAVPPGDAAIRARLKERWRVEGGQTLFSELQAVDPRAAAALDPTKSHRVIRALEVWEATGRPLSAFWGDRSPPPTRFRVYVLHRERAALYDRIERRTTQLFGAGLVDETRALLDQGYSPVLGPLRTIGYQECVAYLSNQLTLDEARRLVAQNTRRYAKRQLTFFRRFDDWEWLSLDDDSHSQRGARTLLQQLLANG